MVNGTHPLPGTALRTQVASAEFNILASQQVAHEPHCLLSYTATAVSRHERSVLA